MLIRPPITGDPQLDSWTDQLTRQINQGLVPGSGGGGAGGVGGGGGAPGRPGVAGTDGNTALFLYQRTTAENVIPARPTSVSFDLSNIQQIVTSANEGWSGDIPTMGGDYLWVTFRYISTATTSPITDANSWDTPTLLGVPGEDGEDAVLVIISSHRLPAGVTATQFAANRLGTLRATTTGFQFRDNLGEPKVLRADTYIRCLLYTSPSPRD